MSDRRDDDRFDELMRRALSEEAGRIEPADGLHEIQARVRDQRQPVSRRPWVITAGAAVVGAAAAVGAFAVLNGTSNNADEPTIAGSAETSTSPTPGPASTPSARPASPKPAPTEVSTPRASTAPTNTGPTVGGPVEEPTVKVPKAVPVYWLGEKVGSKRASDFRLYRTFAQVSGRPTLEAVRLMTMPKAANDPDYQTFWSGATVGSVRYSKELITVDFDQLPDTRLEPGVADMAAQQLVYTVQGGLQRQTSVQITERGRAVSNLFGVLDTKQPFGRAQATDVQALVWVESPENGQTVKPSFTVSGTAAAFEAQVDWKATNVKTKEVVANYAMTKEGQKFSPYVFTPKLTAGEWLIEVYLSSPEDGRVTDLDSKTVYVK
ncbi:Gmad2 immunoglobulin-like domain-containing protein [Kribbella sp. CA-294648]|uniref:Gmad2 immunoglobulin-like domain-containing protein n=1 Tax=Kribbella sp. CA-294648 TaxID=3239948 RepID=UPI003D8F5EF9